jgi:hypothetical protein
MCIADENEASFSSRGKARSTIEVRETVLARPFGRVQQRVK